MKILAIADAVSPLIYNSSFPKNMEKLDLVLSAGDMPGYVLEFIATKRGENPIYVMGNHANEYVNADMHDKSATLGNVFKQNHSLKRLPGGCTNAHKRCIKVKGLLIVGIEGCAKYNNGPQQYTEREMARMLVSLYPTLLWNKLRYGRAVDILLTHAASKGEHEGKDFPHRGVPAFNRFYKQWKPKVHIHGHVHLNGANAKREYLSPEGVRVINAFGHTVVDFPLENQKI